eukprot:SAG11_NODE_968_length_6354_cov_16.546922_7_plen_91_part_00
MLVKSAAFARPLGTELMAMTVFNPNSVLLDFVEMVMGPSVQHDSLQIACYPPVDAAHKSVGYGWHHDGFVRSRRHRNRVPLPSRATIFAI